MNKVTTGLIGLCVLLFLLPWVEASCGGEKIVTLSGFDLAVGKKLDTDHSDENFGRAAEQTVREPIVTIVLFTTILAFILCFLIKNAKTLRTLTIFLGICGFILILIFKFSFDHQAAKVAAKAAKESGLTIQFKYLVGYWLALFIYPMIAIISLLMKEGERKFATSLLGKTTYQKAGPPTFCPKCGYKLSANDLFCPSCGHKIKEV